MDVPSLILIYACTFPFSCSVQNLFLGVLKNTISRYAGILEDNMLASLPAGFLSPTVQRAHLKPLYNL